MVLTEEQKILLWCNAYQAGFEHYAPDEPENLGHFDRSVLMSIYMFGEEDRREGYLPRTKLEIVRQAKTEENSLRETIQGCDAAGLEELRRSDIKYFDLKKAEFKRLEVKKLLEVLR